MAKYKLSQKAVEDLGEIWDFTFDAWSEKQADAYYEMLIENFQCIADNPDIGKKYAEIRTDLLGMKANRHIIFYRKVESTSVEVVRILHEQMDLKQRMSD